MNRFIDRSAQTRCLNLGDHSATFKALSHNLGQLLPLATGGFRASDLAMRAS
jgi:hypothetical protein